MQIIREPDLSQYSSIRIGGLGNFLYQPESEAELFKLLERVKNPIILGGGTNVVFADKVTRDIISLAYLGMHDVSGSGFKVTAGAGVKLSRLVYEGSRQGLSGIEVLAGIPGTVGGAVVMNAGSRYGCIGDYITGVRVLFLDSKKVEVMLPEDIEYAYRSSVFQSGSDRIILSAELEFCDMAPVTELTERVSAIIAERAASKVKYPNCGSAFRNPEHELSAGALIDRLGLKGYRIGGVAISEMHANILVNISGGSYADFCNLVEYVQERVFCEFGVCLELEIRVMR